MNKKYFDELIKELMSIKDKKIMENFLLGLFTPRELEEIPTRIQIVKMLKRELPQVKIAKKLRVGLATVTRGSNEIKRGMFISIH